MSEVEPKVVEEEVQEVVAEKNKEQPENHVKLSDLEGKIISQLEYYFGNFYFQLKNVVW